MNTRIWLVAQREFMATLVSRAFIMLIMTPIIVLVSVPLIVFPIVMLAEVMLDGTGLGEENVKTPAIVVQLVDPDGVVEARLADRLGEDYQVESVDGDRPLLDSDAKLRVTVTDVQLAEGRYRLEAEHGTSVKQVSHVSKNTWRVLSRLRLQREGLSEAKADDLLTIERDLEYVGKDPAENLDIWSVLEEVLEEMKPILAPVCTLFLMFSALSMAGQGLLTSTLEEKTTRVSELLLGAVSPVELLTGKALGQLGVSLVISLVWGGPGLIALWWFAVYTVGPMSVLYLLAFIGIASLSWAAVMGGIGSAMNDLTEAQNILAPLFMVMMMLFIPALVAIGRPNSAVVMVCSWLPPMAAPVMAARVASETPPPHWEIGLGLLTSGGFSLALLWAAGRLYRVGLLLRGAPPNLMTLLRWIRTG